MVGDGEWVSEEVGKRFKWYAPQMSTAAAVSSSFVRSIQTV